MPFLDHLEELRWRILWSLLSVGIGAVVGFILVYYFDVMGLLLHPLRVAYDDPQYELINLSPADPVLHHPEAGYRGGNPAGLSHHRLPDLGLPLAGPREA